MMQWLIDKLRDPALTVDAESVRFCLDNGLPEPPQGGHLCRYTVEYLLPLPEHELMEAIPTFDRLLKERRARG